MTKRTSNEPRQRSSARNGNGQRANRAPSSRQSSGGASSVSKPVPSQTEVWRNRIIAIAVLVVVLFLVVQLVSCIAGAFGGKPAENQEQSTAASGTEIATIQASVEEASSVTGVIVHKVRMAYEESRMPGAGSETGVDDPWVKSGKFTTGNDEIDAWVKGFCDAHSTSDDPSENAHNAYLALLSEFAYGERIENRHPDYPGWDYDYTLQMLAEGSGNCYNDAAMTQWILRYFGYEDATAHIIFVLLQGGNWSDHSSVFVTDVYHGDRQCIVDDALLQDGWMLDADSYVYQIIDIGRELDPESFVVKNAEAIVDPPAFWYDPSVYGDTEEGGN